MSAVLGTLLLTTTAVGQTKGANTANSDPVVCFDDVLRDTENALQVYSIALTKAWVQEANCRQQAPSAPDLGACWDLLLDARPLISQAGNLNEQARRANSPQDADRLSQQAGALMRRAADLVHEARDCFNPVFAQWQKNGGRYIASKNGTSDSETSPIPQIPPSLPPLTPPGPGPRRPAPSQPTPSEPDDTASSPVTLSVRIAAHKAADTIIAGNDSRAALGELNKAQQGLPPNVPRPIQCWGMMVDAASKRSIQPNYAIPQAQRATACYDGQEVAVARRPPTSPGQQLVCELQKLAAIVFQQYGPNKPPIAIYSVAKRPGTYLIALQGLEPGVVEGYDVSQAWLSGARNPHLALAYNTRKAAHGDDQYRIAILDAVKALPPGSKLILSGHSAGGIEAQNLVSELTGLGYRVERVITFGSPITADKVPSTQYTYVKSQGDPVAWLDQRYELTDTLLIPPGPNANPFAKDGSHSIYPVSPELAKRSPDFFDTCLDLVFYASHGLKATEPSLPCATADFSRNRPLKTFDPWSENPSWTRAFASAWWDARTQAEETKISERIGEAGMTQAVRVLRYTTLLSPGQASQRPQGFDAVYRDPDGTLVIADAKGSVSAGLNSVMKSGYNCRQGTMGWAWRAAEATLTSSTSNSEEKRIAEIILNSITKGDRIRIEVFLTEHDHGVPKITKQFVTASFP